MPWNSFSPLTAFEREAVRTVLQSISSVANITFQEVADNATSAGDIRYAYSASVSSSASASAYMPGGTYSPITMIGTAYAYAGDVWIQAANYRSFYPVQGSFDYAALLHETMHALGLKHPFEPGSTGVVLPKERDVIPMTLMSYDEGPDLHSWLSVYPTQPMPIDVSALQFLYGANRTANAGDDTYMLDTDNPTWLHIWDTGGDDAIELSGSRGATLDLREDSWSAIGSGIKIGYDLIWPESLYIDSGSVIENAKGSSGNDTITGNDADNDISGGAGNDTLYGGAGEDTFDWDSSARGGSDTMYGGPGDDTYVSNTPFDTAVELPNEGIDRIFVQDSYSIAGLPNVENLLAIGTSSVTLTGNAANNGLRGNAGNNLIDGGVSAVIDLDGIRCRGDQVA